MNLKKIHRIVKITGSAGCAALARYKDEPGKRDAFIAVAFDGKVHLQTLENKDTLYMLESRRNKLYLTLTEM